jgi:hypothetical protein
MKLSGKRTLGRSIRLAIVSIGLLSTHALVPVNADPGLDAGLAASAGLTGRCEVSASAERRPIGSCEKTLADCLNGGGDSTACWNAYWRCTSR